MKDYVTFDFITFYYGGIYVRIYAAQVKLRITWESQLPNTDDNDRFDIVVLSTHSQYNAHKVDWKLLYIA